MPTTSVISVRVSDDERHLLESAASGSRSPLSEFVRRSAIEAAQEDLMERRVIEIPPENWAAFEAQMNEPPRRIEAIAELMRRTRSWRT